MTHTWTEVWQRPPPPFPKKKVERSRGEAKQKGQVRVAHCTHTYGLIDKGLLTYSRRYCTYLVSGDDEWLRK